MNEIIAPPRTESNSLSVGSLLNFIATAARDPGVDVSKFESLLRMQREIIADDAKLQFNRAMAAVQAEMTPVVRDAPNDQTKSRYARLETIDAMMRPVYSSHGFSLSFNCVPFDGAGIRMICECAHEAGHTRTYHLESALDSTGAKGTVNKTPLHALGSTVSYLRRYLTAMIFHIVLINEDDDGNAAGKRAAAGRAEPMPPKPPALSEWAQSAWVRLDVEPLGQKWMQMLMDALKDCPTLPDVDAIWQCPKVQVAYDGASDATRAKIDAAFQEADARFRKAPPADSKPAETTKHDPVAEKMMNAWDSNRAPPRFEAIIIDANGDRSGAPINDPVLFAKTLLIGWDHLSEDQAAALIEYNEGSIDEARGYPLAAEILKALDEPPAPESQTKSPTVFTAIQPPVERGKTSWVGYVRLIKTALETLPPGDLLAWCLAQRDILRTAGLGQRMLAIEAINKRFTAASIAPPPWLIEITKAPAAHAATSSIVDQIRTGDYIPDTRTSDDRWVDNILADVAKVTTMHGFMQIVQSDAVQKTMRRLKQEHPALFDRADAGFLARNRELSSEGQ